MSKSIKHTEQMMFYFASSGIFNAQHTEQMMQIVEVTEQMTQNRQKLRKVWYKHLQSYGKFGINTDKKLFFT